MKILIVFFWTFLFTLTTKAELKIEPVYGVERTLRQYPEPARYRTNTFLGMRAIYGSPEISGELEVNQSIFQESFPDQDIEVTYTTQKALLGMRSYPIKSKFVGFYIRGGIRAQIQKRDITEEGENRLEEDPLSIDPYAGTGLTLAFANNFALNAGATLVYNKNAADEAEKFDTRYTFAVTVKAGNR